MIFYNLYALILVIIGCAWVFAHEVALVLPPWQSSAIRILGLSSAAILLFLRKERKRSTSSTKHARTQPIRIAIVGSLGFTIYFGTSFAALKHLDASEIGMTMVMIPGVAYIIALIFFGDRFSARKVLGLLIASAGTTIYINKGFNLPSFSSMIGLLLAGGSVLSYAMYGLLYKKWLSHIGVMEIIPYMGLAALVTATPLAAYEAVALGAIPTLKSFLGAFLLGALFTMPVFAIYQKLILLRGPTVANTVGLLTPFSVMIAEIALGKGDGVTGIDLSALAICGLGVWLVLFQTPSAPKLTLDNGRNY